jgi:hypothetical protein
LKYPQPLISVNPPTQTVPAGTSVTVTALIDSGNKTAYPTGTVTIQNASAGGALLAGPINCANAKSSTGTFACQVSGTFTVNSSFVWQAIYSGDTNYPQTFSPGASINVPDFSLIVNTNGVTSTQGQSTPVTVQVLPSFGFSDAVNLSCSGLPAETMCSFNPAQITGGSGSTTLTITTAALGQSRRRASNDNRGLGWIVGAMLPLMGICVIGLAVRGKGTSTLIGLMILSLIILPSCGGGGATNGGGQHVTNNPVPAITSLSPTQQAAGSASQDVTINGSGLMISSSVTYNGVLHPVKTFINTTQMSIQLTSTDLAVLGQYPVVVTNPSPGGGASGASNFGVVTGTPTGTYSVTVTASSGTLTHSSTFGMVVQ